MIYRMMPKISSIKSLIADVFPGILLTGNIFVTINATTVENIFYGSNQLVYIANYNLLLFSTLILVILIFVFFNG